MSNYHSIAALMAVAIVLVLLYMARKGGQSIKAPAMPAFISALAPGDRFDTDTWPLLGEQLQKFVRAQCEELDINPRNTRRLTMWMLRNYYGLTYEQVGIIMDVNRSTAYTTIRRVSNSVRLAGVPEILVRRAGNA